MPDPVPLLFGLLLQGIGLGMYRVHRRRWSLDKQRADLDPHDRRFFHGQFRRRTAVAAVLGLIGAAIPAGDWLLVRLGPAARGWFALYLAALLLLTGLLIALALADLLATGLFARTRIADARARRRVLEAEVDVLRRRLREERASDEIVPRDRPTPRNRLREYE